jgi:hypothetical protein
MMAHIAPSRGIVMAPIRFLACAAMAWFLLFANPAAQAQKSKLGLSPEDQRKYDEHMEAARKGVAVGTLAMQAAAGIMGLALLYGAYSTATKGFKVTEQRRLTGGPAYVVAGVLVLLAIGVAVGGIVYLPTLMP